MALTSNLSQMAREIDYLEKAVFADVGDALAEGLMAEFETLVNQTAQWTGTTAASWNISLGGVGEGGVALQPERSREEALEKGHHEAVSISLARCATALNRLATMGLPGQKGNTYRAIMVENNSPSADHAENGPLRDVNSPNGAFERFKMRVASRMFVVRDRKI